MAFFGADAKELAAEAEVAKRNLVAFRSGIEELRDEKTRMLVRLRNATARLRLQETLSGLSPDADIQALESVRDHVEQIVQEVGVAVGGGDDLERQLGRFRAAEAEAAARSQLEELERARRSRLLPLPVTERAARSGP